MRSRSSVLVAALVLLLAGCSAIPMSGPVQRGPTEAADDTNIVFIPNPPAQGATQQQIVNGFLTAASEGGDFGVARQYLTPKAVAAWKPRSGVLVQREQPRATATSATSLRLQVPISGVVNADGAYTPESGSKPLDFQLVQRSGQWRIDSTPDGIVLGETVFQKAYTPLALQFFDPSYSRLVPDWRWFPSPQNRDASSDPAPSTVIRALIAGPSGPIDGGVTANALDGADLQSVRATPGDVTTVALSVPARSPSSQQVTRIEQQLALSLGLPVPALRLLVNGRLAAPGTSPTDAPAALSASYVIADHRFGTLSSAGTFTEDRTLGKRIAAADPEAVTVSIRQKLAAVLTGAGEVKAVTASTSRTVDRGTSVIAPSLDQQNWIYFVPADAPDSLVAVTAKGRAVDLASDLGGSTITSIEVSPDGTRILVLTGSAKPRASVFGIQRDADGTPTGLTDAYDTVALGGSDGSGIDATWVDDATVAALVRSTDGSIERVWVQPLGRIGFQQGQLANATSIVGGTGGSDLHVLLQSGQLWTWVTNTWAAESSTPIDVSVLAVQR